MTSLHSSTEHLRRKKCGERKKNGATYFSWLKYFQTNSFLNITLTYIGKCFEKSAGPPCHFIFLWCIQKEKFWANLRESYSPKFTKVVELSQRRPVPNTGFNMLRQLCNKTVIESS